jgi:TPR repeat protein
VNNSFVLYLVRKEIQSAFECFRLAADQNHILAHYYLAKMYAEGLGGTLQDCAIAAAVCTYLFIARYY